MDRIYAPFEEVRRHLDACTIDVPKTGQTPRHLTPAQCTTLSHTIPTLSHTTYPSLTPLIPLTHPFSQHTTLTPFLTPLSQPTLSHTTLSTHPPHTSALYLHDIFLSCTPHRLERPEKALGVGHRFCAAISRGRARQIRPPPLQPMVPPHPTLPSLHISPLPPHTPPPISPFPPVPPIVTRHPLELSHSHPSQYTLTSSHPPPHPLPS